MARAKITSSIYNTATGAPLTGVDVRINIRSSGLLATLFTTENGSTTIPNPMETSLGGIIQAWVTQGSYDLIISGTGISSFTQPFEAVNGDNIITLTDANFASANIDGSAGTASLRTLGTGSRQALPGNTLLGGPPSGSAGGGLTGSYPNPNLDLTQGHIWTAEQAAPDFKITGLTGTTAMRLVGRTGGGPPATGSYLLGDAVIDITGLWWICVSAGSPGNWQYSQVTSTIEAVHVVGSGGQPVFQNGWANVNGKENVGFFKDPFGIVHLMGSTDSGTVSTIVFQLPLNYRPGNQIAPSGIVINADGTVVGLSSANTCFDGITFKAGV